MGITENACDLIMSGVSVVSSDASKTQSPYYKYGFNFFEKNEGVPPQVRIKKSSFKVAHGISNTPANSSLPASSSVRVSGSIAFREQKIDVTIWGQDEEECEREFHYFLAGVQYAGFGLNNSEGITQYNLTHVEDGDWAETSADNSLGELIKFSYTLKLNVPKPFYATYRTLISSASVQITGSSVGISVIAP